MYTSTGTTERRRFPEFVKLYKSSETRSSRFQVPKKVVVPIKVVCLKKSDDQPRLDGINIDDDQSGSTWFSSLKYFTLSSAKQGTRLLSRIYATARRSNYIVRFLDLTRDARTRTNIVFTL